MTQSIGLVQLLSPATDKPISTEEKVKAAFFCSQGSSPRSCFARQFNVTCLCRSAKVLIPRRQRRRCAQRNPWLEARPRFNLYSFNVAVLVQCIGCGCSLDQAGLARTRSILSATNTLNQHGNVKRIQVKSRARFQPGI